VAVIGQRESAGVPQHMRMRLEAEPGNLAGALDHARKARSAKGEPRSDVNTNGDGGYVSFRSTLPQPALNPDYLRRQAVAAQQRIVVQITVIGDV
jgi:hypothetical protein